MIKFSKILEIARSEFPDFIVAECTDIGDRYAFGYDVKPPGLLPPGTPTVCVDKESGEISYLTIPPIENLEVLENGRDVPL